MADTFWVRHRSLTGFVGPLTVEQLRAMVAAGSVPAAAEVRLAKPGARAEVLDGDGWTPAAELLGIAASAGDRVQGSSAPGGHAARVGHVLALVRARSQYAGARRIVAILALVAAAFAIATELFVIATMPRSGGLGVVAVLVTVAGAAVQLAGIYVVYVVFQILADLADCALRRETDASARRDGDVQ